MNILPLIGIDTQKCILHSHITEIQYQNKILTNYLIIKKFLEKSILCHRIDYLKTIGLN